MDQRREATTAGQMSGRIDALEASLARKSKEFEIVQTVSVEVNSTLNLGQILDTILTSMESELGFEFSMVLLLGEDGGRLSVVASRGYAEAGIGAQVLLGQGVIGVVAKHRRMMRVNHAGMQRLYASAVRSRMEPKAVERTSEVRLPGLADAMSQLAVPLLVKDRLIGVFAVESRVPNAFDELDESLLTVLGNQAASAIDNARLYALAEERLAALDRANESLEEKVRQRTAELTESIRRLQETQRQLVLQEKMASLGHLVAGLAHEINNPIGVVNSAVDVARRCLARIEEGARQGEDTSRPLHLLTESLSAVHTAGQRIAGLVKNLKVFAHLDEAELQKADLHQGLDSTLELIGPALEQRIEVVREYGALPPVHCAPGQINQVFMSLLLNAVQAIEQEGCIHIRTAVHEGCAHVQIADTGRGIPPEKIAQLFEFSLSSGQSRVKMGVGLSTSYNIVQRHMGDIRVQSEVGKGSTFTIVLPIEPMVGAK